MIIDTHCHLEDDLKSEEKIKKMNNNIIIVSGFNKESNETVLKLCNKYKNVYGTIGIHPEELDDFNVFNLELLEKNLKNEKIVGIGEIGLDYHYCKDNIDKQKELFIYQLELAKKYNKPVVIHSRDAICDTYNILKNYKDLKKVLHCYSGSLEMAKEFMKINTLFGIGGVLTFKNSKQLKEVVENIDLSYIVLETDSPYLTPEPYRGLENEPYNVNLVAQKLSEIKQVSLDKIKEITTYNACNLFDLKNNL